jgi:hypothetical protein
MRTSRLGSGSLGWIVCEVVVVEMGSLRVIWVEKKYREEEGRTRVWFILLFVIFGYYGCLYLAQCLASTLHVTCTLVVHLAQLLLLMTRLGRLGNPAVRHWPSGILELGLFCCSSTMCNPCIEVFCMTSMREWLRLGRLDMSIVVSFRIGSASEARKLCFFFI